MLKIASRISEPIRVVANGAMGVFPPPGGVNPGATPSATHPASSVTGGRRRSRGVDCEAVDEAQRYERLSVMCEDARRPAKSARKGLRIAPVVAASMTTSPRVSFRCICDAGFHVVVVRPRETQCHRRRLRTWTKLERELASPGMVRGE